MKTSPPSLSNLLVRLRQEPANEEAWSALYKRLWPFVYGIVYYRLGGARTAAEDAAQEVFLRLARAWPSLNIVDEAAWRGYVWRVADNVARTWRKKLCLSRGCPEAALETVPSPAPTPEAAAVANSELRRVIASLDGVDLTIVRLLLDGQDLQAVARATGLSYNAAAVRLHRMRLKLHKDLVLNDSHGIRRGAESHLS